ncbi:hypothetical protein, partial [Flagellimonas oceani]|uniref:hypothetical protein n=1 Tax=Flagellimonas oceani TaxID=2698672 RepID=UPI001C677C9D
MPSIQPSLSASTSATPCLVTCMAGAGAHRLAGSRVVMLSASLTGVSSPTDSADKSAWLSTEPWSMS